MTHAERVKEAERAEFIAAVVAMKDRAMRLGLFATGHAFDAVTCAYGQEVGGYTPRVTIMNRDDNGRRRA